MDVSEIRTQIVEIISSEAGLDKDMDCDADLLKMGVQSIAFMKIQIELTKRFAIKLKFKDLLQNNSVNKLAQHLADKQNE
jgi:acyl carrier protein